MDFLTTLLLGLATLVLSTVSFQPPFACDSSTKPLAFCNPQLSINLRARNLVSSMTLYEKIDHLGNTAPAISRLGIPAYQWWNEAIHGLVGFNNTGVTFEGSISAATYFPQVILTAATFDTKLWYLIGQAIGREARAVYNSGQATGLTFWAPNINIFRTHDGAVDKKHLGRTDCG